jgi:oxygen-independent coproporphyrinogen-3 oxidase
VAGSSSLRSSLLRSPGSLSLYVHVPFCRSKCPYCDFFSIGVPVQSVVEQVLRQIEAELDYFAELLAPVGVTTVYVGGGTPSLLPPGLFEGLLDCIVAFLSPKAGGSGRKPSGDPGVAPTGEDRFEWTVEANPESLSREHLETCRTRGVTRLSVGIQSFDAKILSTLGRAGGARESAAALDLLAGGWTGEVNLDLISGIPGQKWTVLRRDLDRALEAAPGHVSLYSLTLDDPAHPLARKLDRDQQERLWLRGCGLLESRGYLNYEISNFARPGHECRHNLRYWLLEPYLGIGPGAVSTLPGPDDSVLRLAHPRSLERYLEGARSLWGLEDERVGPREFLLETLMMGLRLRDGIEVQRFVKRFGAGIQELLPKTWRRWRSGGLVESTEATGSTEATASTGAKGPPEKAEDHGSPRYALSFKGRLLLDRLLVEMQEELEGISEERLAVRWGGQDG